MRKYIENSNQAQNDACLTPILKHQLPNLIVIKVILSPPTQFLFAFGEFLIRPLRLSGLLKVIH